MNTDKIYAEAIANEYSVKTSRKALALQKLDKWVKRPAKIVAVVWGIISSLLNISGLVILVDLPFSIVFSYKLLAFSVYSIGLIGMAVSPLVYKQIFEYRKRENAFDVIKLAREITQSEDERAV